MCRWVKRGSPRTGVWPIVSYPAKRKEYRPKASLDSAASAIIVRRLDIEPSYVIEHVMPFVKTRYPYPKVVRSGHEIEAIDLHLNAARSLRGKRDRLAGRQV